MATIRIERLSDEHDCETCGTSWADGANVYIDDELALELEPCAACFDGDHFTDEDVLHRIFRHFWHTVEYD